LYAASAFPAAAAFVKSDNSKKTSPLTCDNVYIVQQIAAENNNKFLPARRFNGKIILDIAILKNVDWRGAENRRQEGGFFGRH
jgi:hypothetical protein